MVLEFEVSIQYAQVFGATDIERDSAGHGDPVSKFRISNPQEGDEMTINLSTRIMR